MPLCYSYVPGCVEEDIPTDGCTVTGIIVLGILTELMIIILLTYRAYTWDSVR